MLGVGKHPESLFRSISNGLASGKMEWRHGFGFVRMQSLLSLASECCDEHDQDGIHEDLKQDFRREELENPLTATWTDLGHMTMDEELVEDLSQRRYHPHQYFGAE